MRKKPVWRFLGIFRRTPPYTMEEGVVIRDMVKKWPLGIWAEKTGTPGFDALYGMVHVAQP